MRKGWSNKYKDVDLVALKEQATSFFIKKRNSKNYSYIGPAGEYQKWYAVLYRDERIQKKKEWRKNNLDRDVKNCREKGKVGRFKTKILAFQKISKEKIPKCVVCGNNDTRILTINHINGEGRKESSLPGGNNKLYKSIIHDERTVEDLEVRCYNCNILYEYDRKMRVLPENWVQIYKDLINEQ